jgi:hypothetical protein
MSIEEEKKTAKRGSFVWMCFFGIGTDNIHSKEQENKRFKKKRIFRPFFVVFVLDR